MEILENYLSKGFFTFAQNNDRTDYLKLAYLQALNIKYTQKRFNKYSVGITPGMHVPDKYREVFDEVIEIPWGDQAEDKLWKLTNEWKSIYMSPYDMTVKLDSDLLFFEDITDWWYVYSEHDLVPTIEVIDYRGEVSHSTKYRKEFMANELPNFYSAIFYFRKSPIAFDLFEMAREIYEQWRETVFENLYLKAGLEGQMSTTDVVFALASKLMDINYNVNISRFAHMKRDIQDVGDIKLNIDWTIDLKHYFDKDLNLYIENFKQRNPVHYHIKNFGSDSLISKYEKHLGIS